MRRIVKGNKLNNKGFTLIEVLISMSVLVIVSVPMLDTLSGTTVMTRKASTKQRATMLGQSITEGVKRYSTLDLCKAFEKTYNIDDFPILNNENYTFSGYGRLKNSGGVYFDLNKVSENDDKYYFGIYGIAEGIEKYDALVTIDSAMYKDINAEVIPEIVNIGAPGTAYIDITGLYHGEDLFKELEETVEDDEIIPHTLFDYKKVTSNIEIHIKKHKDPVTKKPISYEVYGDVKYTHPLANGTTVTVGRSFLGSRSLDDQQGLNYVYVILGDDKLHGTHNLTFKLDVDEEGRAENIPVAIVTGGNKDVKWNMNIVEGKTNASGTFVNSYNWKKCFTFFSNAEKGKINLRDKSVENSMKDYATSGKKLKRVYSLKVDIYRYEESLQRKFRSNPINSITSSYLRIDVENFNDDQSKAD